MDYAGDQEERSQHVVALPAIENTSLLTDPRVLNEPANGLNTGIPWSDLPARYGMPNPVWKRFDRWCAAGVWERLATLLGDWKSCISIRRA